MQKQLKLILNKLLTYCLPILGAFLGALGGSSGGDKSYRRIAIPLLIMGLAFLETESILVLTICSMIGALSLGYGIPCYDDEGSFLGRIFAGLTNNNEVLSNILVRGFIGLVIGLSLVVIPIIKNTWLPYIICSLLICMVNATVSWQNWGQYTLFGKPLNWSDTINYFLITLIMVILIKIGV